jgi:cell filamentation protein
MKNKYEYIDPDYIYTDPQTGILRNKENIEDYKLLVNYESFKCSERLEELKAKPIKIKNYSTLLAIHKHLFQDVYEWAGQKRTVEISKDDKQFFPVNHFNTAFSYIDNLIYEYRTIDKIDKTKLSVKLAEILDAINYLHPFREGNGRTQREFLRVLAIEKELMLNLNPPDNSDIYERYMSGTIDGDTQKLSKLILELINGIRILTTNDTNHTNDRKR